MKKTFRILGLVLVALALLTGFGAMIASADGPVANAVPAGAPYIDNQSHTIQPSAGVWYKFDYLISDESNRPQTSIDLVYGNASGLSFEVWTSDGVADTADNKPIGLGETFMVAGDSGMSQSPDLMWVGAFGASGTYYVHVINNNSTPTDAKLTITGDGVQLAPAPIAVTGPSAVAAQPTVNMDDPAKAVAIDGTQKSIPANSVQWYMFNYGLNDDGSRPTKTVTLTNGNQQGVSFDVYAPEILANWWENHPTGSGAPIMVAGDSGMTPSADLVWQGSFGATGTYYVRVSNSTDSAFNAVLTIQ